jgi:phage terminase large subunit GpA-like protein
VAQAFQAALDTGGSHTHQAYAFVRRHAHRKLWGVKGESADGKAIKSRRKLIDIKHSGRLLRKGVALWFVGTDTAKTCCAGGSNFTRLHVTATGLNPPLAGAFMAALREEYGTEKIYIPAPDKVLRDAAIRERFDGTNREQLRREFGVAERRPRNESLSWRAMRGASTRSCSTSGEGLAAPQISRPLLMSRASRLA